MESGQTTDELRRLEQRVIELETANTALRDDSDAQEQYSRRNCLLVHDDVYLSRVEIISTSKVATVRANYFSF